MEVDGGLRGAKLKVVTVGGLLQADGTVQHGYRGCLQVSSATPWCSASAVSPPLAVSV